MLPEERLPAFPGHAEELPRAELIPSVASVVLLVVSSCAVESPSPTISSFTRWLTDSVASVESIGLGEGAVPVTPPLPAPMVPPVATVPTVPPVEDASLGLGLHPTTNKPALPSSPTKPDRKFLIIPCSFGRIASQDYWTPNLLSSRAISALSYAEGANL